MLKGRIWAKWHIRLGKIKASLLDDTMATRINDYSSNIHYSSVKFAVFPTGDIYASAVVVS